MIGRKQPPVAAEKEEPRGFDAFELRLGDVMRGERATLGKSLLDVQRELKIKATYIAAIENADPSAFETPGFVAGYVRSYARYLGMDPEWAYDRFCKEGNFATVHGMAVGASGHKAAATQAQKRSRKEPLADPKATFVPQGQALLAQIEPGAVGSVMVLVALIGALGFGGWTVLQEIQRVRLAPVEQAPGVTAEVDPLIGATVVADAGATDTDNDITVPTPDRLDRLYRPQALDVPVLVARDGPISTLVPGSVGALTEEAEKRRVAQAERLAPVAPPTALETPQVVVGTAPEVVLFAVRPAWVRVRSADGTVLFEKILDAGERYILPKTEEPPVLRAGNSGSVYFAVNGQTFGPAAPGASVVKGVVLSADALSTAYELADLTQDPDLARAVAVAEAPVPSE